MSPTSASSNHDFPNRKPLQDTEKLRPSPLSIALRIINDWTPQQEAINSRLEISWRLKIWYLRLERAIGIKKLQMILIEETFCDGRCVAHHGRTNLGGKAQGLIISNSHIFNARQRIIIQPTNIPSGIYGRDYIRRWSTGLHVIKPSNLIRSH